MLILLLESKAARDHEENADEEKAGLRSLETRKSHISSALSNYIISRNEVKCCAFTACLMITS